MKECELIKGGHTFGLLAVITTRQDNPHKEELQNNISPISEEDATISQVQNNISPISGIDLVDQKNSYIGTASRVMLASGNVAICCR